jgi:putative sporulation protein YyaC
LYNLFTAVERILKQSDGIKKFIYEDVFNIYYSHIFAKERLSEYIQYYFQKGIGEEKEIIIVCIGTDRSTGDCLGPLIGTKLTEMNLPITIYGTLDNPVHAQTLQDTIDKIQLCERYTGRSSYILAIDAALGKSENVGKIYVNNGQLHPGTGVNKSLPPIGNFNIFGVVNVDEFMKEYLILQNTRLSLVMNMANTICDSILIALDNLGLISRGSSQVAASIL